MYRYILFLLLQVSILAGVVSAQSVEQYRGFWVETFNTPLNNHDDIVSLVNNVKTANSNVILVQVRRRGDSWYIDSLEPRGDRSSISDGFDPLADLIKFAHTNSIEVHAFVITGAVWQESSPNLLPESPEHVFNKHGYDKSKGRFYEGRDNWLTKSNLPDDNFISQGGYKIGKEYWIDLGHPDAAQYTHDVLMHLVKKYDIDGLHLDRIRYPELLSAGQSQRAGAPIGYNETSITRFNKRYSIVAGAPPPAANDERWNRWRRVQVTNFVRRVYLDAIAVKPKLKISAAVITFGSAASIPKDDNDWTSTESYWRIFQDWRGWLDEGILDMAVIMNYRREHSPTAASIFDAWNEWAKNHQYNRSIMIGMGAYLNSIEGNLRQTSRALAPSVIGKRAAGVAYFSFANVNDAVSNNPHAIPYGATPKRSFDEFASALTSGKSVDGTVNYEEPSMGRKALFAEPVVVPEFPWKSTPLTGHIRGIITTKNNDPVDGVDIAITRVDDGTYPSKGRIRVSTSTDGNGFYGAVNLIPGFYKITLAQSQSTASDKISVTPRPVECYAIVSKGSVASFDINIGENGHRYSGGGSYCFVTANTILPEVQPKISADAVMQAPQPIESKIPMPSPEFVNGAKLRTAANGLLCKIKNDGSVAYEAIAHFDAFSGRYIPKPVDMGGGSEKSILILFGQFSRKKINSQKSVAVKIGNVTLSESDVLFIGSSMDMAGVDQINVRIPQSLNAIGLVEITINVDGQPSEPVTINLKK